MLLPLLLLMSTSALAHAQTVPTVQTVPARKDGLEGPTSPSRGSEAIWPNLDNGCKPMKLDVWFTDLDIYPRLSEQIENRLRSVTRKMFVNAGLYSAGSSSGGEAIFRATLDVSPGRRIFFSEVSYERPLFDPVLDRSIDAVVWHKRTFGTDFNSVHDGVDETLVHVATFIGHYKSVNKCKDKQGE